MATVQTQRQPRLAAVARPGFAPSAPARAAATSSSSAGATLVATLRDRQVGDCVRFPQPLSMAGRQFQQATILREFRTVSKAKLIQLQPGNAVYVCKFEDVTKEHALMCALRQMNARWSQRRVALLGCPVEAVTYGILPLGHEAGLVEVVPESMTFRELSKDSGFGERHLRVLRALRNDPRRLDKLAASTVAYLTAGYTLGLRDGHDDNIMLRSDGAFFRIDFGFAFGRTPEIDAPNTFVPNAVVVAMGQQRWAEVVNVCGKALQALCGNLSPGGHLHEPPGWDCLRSVPQLGPLLPEARSYAQTLSFDAFGREVLHADEWSLTRAAKNTLREAVRYLLDDGGEVDPGDAWTGHPGSYASSASSASEHVRAPAAARAPATVAQALAAAPRPPAPAGQLVAGQARRGSGPARAEGHARSPAQAPGGYPAAAGPAAGLWVPGAVRPAPAPAQLH